MNTFFSHHESTKTRKPHRCRVCDETINPGDRTHIYRGASYGEAYTIYFHPECWQYSRDWDEVDWECQDPGTVSYDEVKRELAQP